MTISKNLILNIYVFQANAKVNFWMVKKKAKRFEFRLVLEVRTFQHHREHHKEDDQCVTEGTNEDSICTKISKNLQCSTASILILPPIRHR